ncbi:MAG: hypothetical protein JW973_15655 [Bacteroidales bacterium]|nr:hypothetical protein [Bacteroidales bacterium]
MKNKIEFPHYPPIFFIRLTEGMRNLFLRLYRRFTHPNVAVFEMVHHFWLAAALGVVAELGIADILKKGSTSVRELASLTNTHEDSLYRLMRMLSSHNIFREQKNRLFTLTPLAKALQEEQVKYLIISHLTKLHFQMFSELMYSVRTGKNVCQRLTGNTLFDHIGKDEQRNELFIKAMTNVTMMQVAAILSVYSFRPYKNIIDIGGGQGLMMAAILQKYPGCRGIVFDLPQSSHQASHTFEEYDIADRSGFVAGNFFETIPGNGDLYILKNVLHDWDDETCRKILMNILSVMSSTAKLIVIEQFIERKNKPSFGKMMDMLMMISTGGKERTKAEYKTLLQQTGFRIRKIYRTISPFTLVEAEKMP